MAHISRHELKRDELRTTLEEFEDVIKKHAREIVTVVGIVIVVGGLTLGLKTYRDRQQAGANARLGAALETFHAYVGTAAPGAQTTRVLTFPTARDKYKKALEQFHAVIQEYSTFPQPKAAAIARYHVGLCQAQLGDHEGAIRTLTASARESDQAIASLAKFALAGELRQTGRTDEAIKIYQELADHPSSTVPEAAARLAIAEAYRAAQPAKAREIYQQLEKKFGSDVTLSQALKEQIASLPEK